MIGVPKPGRFREIHMSARAIFGRSTFGFGRRSAPWRLLLRSFVSRFSSRPRQSNCPIRESRHAKNRGGRPRINRKIKW